MTGSFTFSPDQYKKVCLCGHPYYKYIPHTTEWYAWLPCWQEQLLPSTTWNSLWDWCTIYSCFSGSVSAWLNYKNNWNSFAPQTQVSCMHCTGNPQSCFFFLSFQKLNWKDEVTHVENVAMLNSKHNHDFWNTAYFTSSEQL